MSAGGPVLRDIHLPPAAWWPPAPGWWLLAGLVALSVAAVAWWTWRRVRRRPLRAALREVDALAAAYARDDDAAQLVDAASRLVRRVACMIDPAAASRPGDAWRTFLYHYARDTATKESLQPLIAVRYQAHPVLEAPALLAALRAWCRSALRGPRRQAARRLDAQTAFPRRFKAFPFASKGGVARVRRAKEGASS